MSTTLLIKILLQLGIINNATDFDAAKSEQYINHIENTEGIIMDDIVGG